MPKTLPKVRSLWLILIICSFLAMRGQDPSPRIKGSVGIVLVLIDDLPGPRIIQSPISAYLHFYLAGKGRNRRTRGQNGCSLTGGRGSQQVRI